MILRDCEGAAEPGIGAEERAGAGAIEIVRERGKRKTLSFPFFCITALRRFSSFLLSR